MTTVISFYTQDWEYPIYAESLAIDCRKLEVPCVIEELKSTRSYLRNTCLKPKFIYDKLLQLQGPLLWIDCDGSLLKKPVFFDGLVCDFAAKKKTDKSDRCWHVGTMFFNYTPAMVNFLEQWIKNTGKLSDESSLEVTWREIGHTINVSDIPKEYFDIIKGNIKPENETVIMHRISSGVDKKREMYILKHRRRRK